MPARPPATPEPTPAASATTAPVDPDELLRYDEDDPLGNLEKADGLDALARAPAMPNQPVPPGGCVVAQPALRVWGAAAKPAITALPRGFIIAGYEANESQDKGERVFLVHLPETGPPSPLTSLRIKVPHPGARRAPPGLSARDDSHVSLAVTDGEGKVLLAQLRVDSGGHGALVEIASGADTRFAPSVAHSADKTLVVFTEGSTPMRAQLVIVGSPGEQPVRHDLTAPSMGAAAATFIDGASPPVVLAVDARDGMSPVVRVDLSSEGEPGKPEVAVPVSMVSSPPRLSAAATGIGTYLGYTGLGSAATSAIGLVAISPIVGSPTALVPGTAYGPLHVSAAAAPRALLFAVSVPKEGGKEPDKRLHVHVVGAGGAGSATTIEGPSGKAQDPAIARDQGGTVAVAYVSGAAVYVALLSCDDA